MNKKSVIITVLIVLIIIAGAFIVYFVTNKSDDSLQASSTTEETFSVKFDGVEIVPGTEFNESEINEESDFSEIPSCAFEGTDKMYTYSNVEIVVAKINKKDTVYSVYFIDDTIQTAEGVKITDSKDVMIEKYGSDYENTLENKYVYTKNNVELSFIIENNIITGIEYTLVTSN